MNILEFAQTTSAIAGIVIILMMSRRLKAHLRTTR